MVDGGRYLSMSPRSKIAAVTADAIEELIDELVGMPGPRESS